MTWIFFFVVANLGFDLPFYLCVCVCVGLCWPECPMGLDLYHTIYSYLIPECLVSIWMKIFVVVFFSSLVIDRNDEFCCCFFSNHILLLLLITRYTINQSINNDYNIHISLNLFSFIILRWKWKWWWWWIMMNYLFYFSLFPIPSYNKKTNKQMQKSINYSVCE